jgi:acyl dehydratase
MTEPHWDELFEGLERAPFTDAPLTLNDTVRYQGASGGLHPIHHDPEVAKRAGYPRPFAVGMRQAGVLAAYVTDWLGPSNVRRFKVRFLEIAWPGDTLTYRAVVAAKYVDGDDHFIDLDLAVVRQTGGIHIKGWATYLIADRSTP